MGQDEANVGPGGPGGSEDLEKRDGSIEEGDSQGCDMSSSSEVDEPHGATVCEFFQNVFLSVSKTPESLDDLCDGVVMFEALSEISMDHFDPSSIGRDFGENWALKASNLKKLVRNLEDFYHDELGKDAEFASLSSRTNEIAKGEDMDGLMEIVELVMVAATLCDDRLVL